MEYRFQHEEDRVRDESKKKQLVCKKCRTPYNKAICWKRLGNTFVYGYIQQEE